MFSLTVLIWENTGRRKSLSWHVLRSLYSQVDTSLQFYGTLHNLSLVCVVLIISSQFYIFYLVGLRKDHLALL